MKTNKTMASLAVMSIFFIVPGGLILNPALQNLAEAFPQIHFTTVLLLSTLPYLVVVPSTIIAGVVAGSKIKYKTLLVISTLLFAISGTAPYFMSDFYMILISRIFFGMGVGLATPLGNALVMKLFEGQQRANMMGMGSVVMNIAGIFFMMLSGFVCSINVKYTWLVHLSALIPLILLVVFFSEPEKTEQIDGDKVKMPIGVYLISAAFGLIFMLFNPLLLNMSTILISEKLGNAATAATILSMYTVGGIIGGVLFGKVFKITGKYTISLGLLLMVLGFGICNYSYSILMLMVGCTITGVGLFLVFPAIMMEVGQMVPPDSLALGSGIAMGSINLGSFISPFYMIFLTQVTGNSSPRFPIFVDMILIILMAVVWGFVKIKEKSVVPLPPEA